MIWCEWWGGAMRSIETLVTSQNAADCCKVFVGCRAWLQIRWPFFSLSFSTPLLPCLSALLLVCTPAPCSVRPFQWLWRQRMRPPQQCSSAGCCRIEQC
ncbi:hypothetical protein V8C34DRAFT_272256 [Trichoderma compactum]